MAENRFKKSISSATDNTQENILQDTKDSAIDTITEDAEENTLSEASSDILEKVLKGGKKDKGGNHTIYLSADVGEALIKYAKKSKKSKSELVDSILREVFKL